MVYLYIVIKNDIGLVIKLYNNLGEFLWDIVKRKE